MFFRRKRNQGLFSEVDDSRQIVYDFRRRTQMLFESYRAVSYKKPPTYDLEKMKAENAETLEKLIASCAVDAGNEECLVDKILGPIRDGIRYLDDQYLDHMDFYTRQGARVAADSADIGELLTLWEEKEKAMVKEHEHTQMLWKEYCGYGSKEV